MTSLPTSALLPAASIQEVTNHLHELQLSRGWGGGEISCPVPFDLLCT